MAIAFAAGSPVATSATTVTVGYTGSGSGGATVYYGTTTAVGAISAFGDIATKVTAGSLVAAGTKTTASGTVLIGGLTKNTGYTIVVKDNTAESTDYASSTVTTGTVRDLVENDTTPNLLGTARSSLAYATQSGTISLDGGQYVTVVVLQTTAAVTDSRVQTWFSEESSPDANAAYQIVASSGSALPAVSGLAPSVTVTAAVKYDVSAS